MSTTAIESIKLAEYLVIYGPMGVMLIWFGWRAETKFDKVLDRVDRLTHRIQGMTQAMLVEVASRENAGSIMRAQAQQMLSKIDRESASDAPYQPRK